MTRVFDAKHPIESFEALVLEMMKGYPRKRCHPISQVSRADSGGKRLAPQPPSYSIHQLFDPFRVGPARLGVRRGSFARAGGMKWH